MTTTVACPRPKCDQNGFANPGMLAGHLVTDHLMAGSAALLLARQTAGEVRQAAATKVHPPSAASPVPPREEPRLPPLNPNGNCGYCKRPFPEHSENCRSATARARKAKGIPATPPRGGAKKRKAITRRHPKPSRKIGAPKGAQADVGLLSELDALRSTAAALEPLGPIERMHVLACVCKLLAIDTSELAA